MPPRRYRRSGGGYAGQIVVLPMVKQPSEAAWADWAAGKNVVSTMAMANRCSKTPRCLLTRRARCTVGRFMSVGSFTSAGLAGSYVLAHPPAFRAALVQVL